jgi:glycosyltransferase involved in cell wall biosynthesis
LLTHEPHTRQSGGDSVRCVERRRGRPHSGRIVTPLRTALRVVIVNKFAHLTGGADQHCLGLAAALRQRGHDVAFLSTHDERNLEHDGRFIHCSVTHASRDSVGLAAQAAVFAKAAWNREAASAMQRLIDDLRPDVVHTHKLYPQLSVAPVVVAARAGVPVVQTLHDFEMISASPIDARGGLWDRDETRARFRLLNAALRPVHRRVHAPRVNAFVAVSRFVARVHAAHGIDASVFPNFVLARESGAADIPSFEERNGIVFLGRLRPEKGVLDVVGMAKRLPEITVTIVGAGDLEPMLRREAGLLGNLKLAGFVPDPDVRDTLRRARVVVIPSRCQDAGPLVPLEAMAHGTPVVAYSMGGLGEYVVDSGGGRVVPVDVDALATTSLELHEDRRTWDRLSAAGFEAVTQRHSPEVYAARIEDLYEGLQ